MCEEISVSEDLQNPDSSEPIMQINTIISVAHMVGPCYREHNGDCLRMCELWLLVLILHLGLAAHR
jgi:hypothetical protein